MKRGAEGLEREKSSEKRDAGSPAHPSVTPVKSVVTLARMGMPRISTICRGHYSYRQARQLLRVADFRERPKAADLAWLRLCHDHGRAKSATPGSGLEQHSLKLGLCPDRRGDWAEPEKLGGSTFKCCLGQQIALSGC